MYFYKFNGSKKPVDTLICNAEVDGYISFGVNVDWTKWDFDGNKLVLVVIPEPEPVYVPTLDEAKAQRREYIKQKRNEAEAASPFLYDGSLFDYDSLSRERINSAVIGSTIAAMSGMDTNTVVASWRLYDNSERNMKVSDWLAFKQAEIARSGECFSKAAGLKAQIDACTTVEEVQAIEW